MLLNEHCHDLYHGPMSRLHPAHPAGCQGLIRPEISSNAAQFMQCTFAPGAPELCSSGDGDGEQAPFRSGIMYLNWNRVSLLLALHRENNYLRFWIAIPGPSFSSSVH